MLTDEGITVFIQHFLILTLRGLTHERISNGPGDGGGVEAVVLEALGYVDGLNTTPCLELTHVKNKLVCIESYVCLRVKADT